MSVTKAEIDQISEIVERLISLLGVDILMRVSANLEGVNINLTGKDSAMMIGYHGDNLSSFSYVLSLIVQRKLDKRISLNVDVDNYLAKKSFKIEKIVKEAIKNIKKTGNPEELRGLSAYERKIAHQIVSKEGLESESVGEGSERRLVIKKTKADKI
ncbi:TPA: hypothetical protein DDW69_01010 [candidate division CPR2 bacterium]|uniref:Putative RNA-binding protein n=1 Tax=candidate division CPR2 bacterium GW2011_GWC1_41_48 TaxID=1618344 RepID=A0A0G0W6S2_UNCC2|nr:MAG: putative RNA-binding protein [candidate division CPR2 bacterium GW2011_GWC2_39_35]KKR28763.1 MAG: putative RNA-binding protein [candidate division CPR2 bacterium GW2011_GWD2_39_7]KKS08650.1 MAG: putative RNA-binding protein [candidate division CPR2 bacterium GW2011_GWC1_41_48]OGB73151.1 MAG: hypothetical protein A2Y26_03180 [candidate division CPR2 bacterium GWD2_39_7]HBG81400.1 hypothetical protein [candidate division CPR2 bacterium]